MDDFLGDLMGEGDGEGDGTSTCFPISFFSLLYSFSKSAFVPFKRDSTDPFTSSYARSILSPTRSALSRVFSRALRASVSALRRASAGFPPEV